MVWCENALAKTLIWILKSDSVNMSRKLNEEENVSLNIKNL
jgi:hypothetical protein